MKENEDIKLPEREDLWVPPSVPVFDIHEMTIKPEDFDPAKRGAEAPRDSKSLFGVFVAALHDVAASYNDALRKCKCAKNQKAFDEAAEELKGLSKKFVSVVTDTEEIEGKPKYGNVVNETFVDPVLNNGYIVDLRIVAQFGSAKGSGEHGLTETHSSSMVCVC